MALRGPGALGATFGGILVGVAAAVLASAVANRQDPGGASPAAAVPAAEAAPAPSAAAGAGPGAQADPLRNTPVVRAVAAVEPAVVSITTEVPVDNPFAVFYGRTTASAEGSGVVIDPDGIVLTNAHVVEGASRITATFPDGRGVEAELLGITPELDLAVLRLPGERGLTAVEVGSSAGLMLGEPVIAIGNPFGLGQTVTTGVVSALNRSLETDDRVYQDFIQTDASINPGNSGGPLLDIHGRLIGINTAIRSDAENIGFAIPVDRAIKVARDLVRFGEVKIPWLGVDLEDVVVDMGRRRITAARVVRVHPGVPGFEVGDVLTAVDGRAVQGRSDLNAYLAGFRSGRVVTVELLRDGRPVTVQVKAGDLPDSVVDESIAEVMGIRVADARGRGVVVTAARPDRAFARLGLRAGDVIVAVNGRRVDGVEAFRAAIARAKSGHQAQALLTVRRGQAMGSLRVPI